MYRGKTRDERRPFTARVELRAAIAGLSAVVRTTNVSRSGVFVETTELLDVGEALVLSFPEPDGPGVRVHGRVRWATPFGTIEDPRPGMGVEFTGMDDSKRARLAAILERREGKDG
jgi:Tfp pilus assembly protein PilZ